MDLGWLWCSNVGSSTVTKIPLWWEIDDEEGSLCVHGGGGYLENFCTFCSIFYESKTAKKKWHLLKTNKKNKKQLNRVELFWLKCMESSLLSTTPTYSHGLPRYFLRISRVLWNTIYKPFVWLINKIPLWS